MPKEGQLNKYNLAIDASLEIHNKLKLCFGGLKDRRKTKTPECRLECDKNEIFHTEIGWQET